MDAFKEVPLDELHKIKHKLTLLEWICDDKVCMVQVENQRLEAELTRVEGDKA